MLTLARDTLKVDDNDTESELEQRSKDSFQDEGLKLCNLSSGKKVMNTNVNTSI